MLLVEVDGLLDQRREVRQRCEDRLRGLGVFRHGQVEIVVGTHFLGDGDPDFNERIAPGVPGDQVALNHPTQLEWVGAPPTTI